MHARTKESLLLLRIALGHNEERVAARRGAKAEGRRKAEEAHDAKRRKTSRKESM